MRTPITFTVIAASILLLGACSSTTKLGDKAPVEDHSGHMAGAGTGQIDPRTVSTLNAGASDPLNDPQGVLAKRSIYFDTDSYSVKGEFQPVVEAHSKYLVKNSARKIIIQGNTDERGGREYNLALGQKRAEAVRKSLSLLGVPEAQMEAVSLGKEKPKAAGSDEAAWAENRRADIVYP